MPDLTLYTFDWVPEMPRGLVRDLRVRWALEEAALPYRVRSVSFAERRADHFSHQPFGQVPWLTDGDVSVFESGAILLYLGGLSEALMPAEAPARLNVTQWVFAALNSVEMAALPWALKQFGRDDTAPPLDDFLSARLGHMEAVVTKADWLCGHFSIADILMADVFRLVDRFDGLAAYPACHSYLKSAIARPAFTTALRGQMDHFAAADTRLSE
ncbi:glutathione S-transferase [Hyphobacterium sp. CCMP332]|uniref:glutathione S-transferase family protein n=1 Tax=Hyphobacterium sp. CCMP332 TaxID=2749086 RepID=UPI0016504735|nr:glutathione S-transferase [Hyphobacterium sp. CCMP332]QNL20031.1 glutathione S-transferase [Hyphobacterium sp. CCMP332]